MNCNFSEKCKKAKNNSCPLFENEDNFCLKLFKINTLLDECSLTEKQKKEVTLRIKDSFNDCDYDNYVKLNTYYNNIEDFVKNGTNLYIFSTNTGNGKTTWALKLLIHYISSIWYKCDVSCHGLFINVPRFLLSLKSYISDKNDNYIPHIQKNVLDVDVVIWDDIATKNMTEYEKENLLSIINSRIDNGKCNIFTSNINPERLTEFVGPRLASRILQSILIPLKGPDMRGVNFDTINCD